MVTEKEIKKKEKKKEKMDLKLASRQLIQILGINPKIPVAIQNKIKDIQTAKDAEDKGLTWINQILSVLGKIPESATSVKRARFEALDPKVPVGEQKSMQRKKGGIVQKFSKGGTVERPRGVGIAKRGYGKVMR
jgi:hypothetical protein